MVRFRLQSDSNLEFDGWYVDNVALSDPSCLQLLGAGDAARPNRLEFLPPSPNPVRGTARFAFALPDPESRVEIGLFDVSGRVVRSERIGPKTPGRYAWVWDGRDGHGRTVASGAYFARLMVGGRTLTQKVLKLAQ